MRKILSLLCAAALSAPFLAAAADVPAEAGKNRCLLDSQSCAGQRYSLPEIIVQLQNEVKKGTSVYTSGELALLQAKLEEYEATLAVLTSGS